MNAPRISSISLNFFVFYRFGKNVKIVHFIGASKPWKCSFDRNGDPVPNLPEDSNSLLHLRNWWNIHNTEILPKRKQKVSNNDYLKEFHLNFMENPISISTYII